MVLNSESAQLQWTVREHLQPASVRQAYSLEKLIYIQNQVTAKSATDPTACIEQNRGVQTWTAHPPGNIKAPCQCRRQCADHEIPCYTSKPDEQQRHSSPQHQQKQDSKPTFISRARHIEMTAKQHNQNAHYPPPSHTKRYQNPLKSLVMPCKLES